jgi:hypothetical protein
LHPQQQQQQQQQQQPPGRTAPGADHQQHEQCAATSSAPGVAERSGVDVLVTAGPPVLGKQQGPGVMPFVSPSGAGSLEDVGPGLGGDQAQAGQEGTWGSNIQAVGSSVPGVAGKQQQPPQQQGLYAAGAADALEQLLLQQAGMSRGASAGAGSAPGVWPSWLSPPRQSAAGLRPVTRAVAGRHSWQGGALSGGPANGSVAGSAAVLLQSGQGLLSSKGLLYGPPPAAAAVQQQQGGESWGLGSSMSEPGIRAAGASLDAYMAILQE